MPTRLCLSPGPTCSTTVARDGCACECACVCVHARAHTHVHAHAHMCTCASMILEPRHKRMRSLAVQSPWPTRTASVWDRLGLRSCPPSRALMSPGFSRPSASLTCKA